MPKRFKGRTWSRRAHQLVDQNLPTPVEVIQAWKEGCRKEREKAERAKQEALALKETKKAEQRKSRIPVAKFSRSRPNATQHIAVAGRLDRDMPSILPWYSTIPPWVEGPVKFW